MGLKSEFLHDCRKSAKRMDPIQNRCVERLSEQGRPRCVERKRPFMPNESYYFRYYEFMTVISRRPALGHITSHVPLSTFYFHNGRLRRESEMPLLGPVSQ